MYVHVHMHSDSVCIYFTNSLNYHSFLCHILCDVIKINCIYLKSKGGAGESLLAGGCKCLPKGSPLHGGKCDRKCPRLFMYTVKDPGPSLNTCS